jgi:DNA-binding GntR family transcriptional regulator
MVKRNRTRISSNNAPSKSPATVNGARGNDQTKTEKAYQAIKRAIVKGELTEGTFLSEGDVIQKYGVGRTPFREACNRLIHEGLLEIVPRRGYLVPELSFHDVRDLFELRVLLESAIIELATVRAGDEEIEELTRLAAEVPKRRKAASNGFETIIEANARFHLQLVKTTRNQELQRLLASVLERTERVMYVELRFTKFDENAFKMIHEPIIEAMRKRDVEAAREALMRDIAQAQDATFGRLLRGPQLATDLKR